MNEGRRKLNLSEWDRPQKEAKDAVKAIEKGEMPLRSYVLARPEARLQPAERERLIAGLRAMLDGQNAANPREKHDEEEPE